MGEQNNIPRHVAVIMDGNGRWAVERGLPRAEGHAAGVESVREAIRSAVRHGVEYLTLYVFSRENWGRPTEEVDALMELLCRCVRQETPELLRQGVRVMMVGDRSDLPAEVRGDIERIEADTAEQKTITVILALSYGSRAEIAEAARRIARTAVRGEIAVADITTETVAANLYTAGVPDPDLVIRTGGDQRLSNFLLWQAAYAEFYFTPEYWPDFGAASFDRAMAAYGGRERKFGLVK
ncbi:MAG: polyprenyl diphosphate synthase [Rikenellaceae bacterium]|nr:polyprenyl diphosphate synthase [Rikenellaceae bacterium]MCL2692215.1 polyprenyl diphosphate synthase [Rikenellaceae bacterium]